MGRLGDEPRREPPSSSTSAGGSGAAPILCVNFLSDGHERFARTREGNRTGDAREAADWVSYCNDPDNPARRRDGAAAPYGVKLWQIGNETSYGDGGVHEGRGDRPHRRVRPGDAGARPVDPADWLGRPRPKRRPYAVGGRHGAAGRRVPRLRRHSHDAADPCAAGHGAPRESYQDDPARAWEELIEISRGRSRLG